MNRSFYLGRHRECSHFTDVNRYFKIESIEMDELLERFQDAFDLQEKGPPAEMALADAAERRLLLGVLNFPEAVSDSLDLLAVHPPLRPRPDCRGHRNR